MNMEPCHANDRYKGIFSPRCNCYPCWVKFFTVNAMKMYTAALAMDKYGSDTLVRVQGKKYVKALKLYLKEEEAKGNKII